MNKYESVIIINPNIEANPALITELERVYRITDEVIKFIVVKEEE